MPKWILFWCVDMDEPKVRVRCCDFSKKLKRLLSDIIDADFGLLRKLHGVLTDRDYESLRQYDSSYDRNDRLMEMVNCLQEHAFLEALQATHQQHVVNFIKQQQSEQKGLFALLFGGDKTKTVKNIHFH